MVILRIRGMFGFFLECGIMSSISKSLKKHLGEYQRPNNRPASDELVWPNMAHVTFNNMINNNCF